MSKFNWGHGLVIFFILFVGTLGMVLYKSFSINRDLVKEDYYIDDLELKALIEKKQNANRLEGFKIDYESADRVIYIQFPEGMSPNGNIQLYRPSDKSKDIIFPIEVDSKGKCVIPISNIDKGLWRIKLDWTDGNNSYYKEEVFTI